MSKEEKPFKKVSPTEYEIVIGGKTKLINVPFGKTEKIFACFISAGGIINEYGEVTTDILSLISSFKSVGDTLLTEFDDAGKVVTEGNCNLLSSVEVISLFQLATEVVENFIKELATLQKPTVPSPEEGSASLK